ncbi:MAG: 4-(cytidine 5'-diphospho)-2-C-methyl-D-erythritol kinase [Thermoguttaceae bacterium]
MRIRRSPTEVVIQAPAKLNLFFEVLAKRTDGFHEIETLMCPIDLYDTLHFREDSGGKVRLRCRWAVDGSPGGCGLDQVPEGPDNLVFRAVELVRRRAGVCRGAELLLTKRIPAAAGLGGGSSDAAAALVAANEGWQLGRSPGELADWAAELGSDVPFFLAGGPAVCRGRGERVTPVSGLGGLSFVVVRPPEGLATAGVYGACRPAAAPRPVGCLWEAFKQGDWAEAGRLLWNGLQPAAESLSPWVKRLEQAFAQLDCLGHAMSGSGTSYFGLFRHVRHARRSARRLRASGVGTVFAVRSCI